MTSKSVIKVSMHENQALKMVLEPTSMWIGMMQLIRFTRFSKEPHRNLLTGLLTRLMSTVVTKKVLADVNTWLKSRKQRLGINNHFSGCKEGLRQVLCFSVCL